VSCLSRSAAAGSGAARCQVDVERVGSVGAGKGQRIRLCVLFAGDFAKALAASKARRCPLARRPIETDRAQALFC
jgi:hypothetical protein